MGAGEICPPAPGEQQPFIAPRSPKFNVVQLISRTVVAERAPGRLLDGWRHRQGVGLAAAGGDGERSM